MRSEHQHLIVGRVQADDEWCTYVPGSKHGSANLDNQTVVKKQSICRAYGPADECWQHAEWARVTGSKLKNYKTDARKWYAGIEETSGRTAGTATLADFMLHFHCSRAQQVQHQACHELPCDHCSRELTLDHGIYGAASCVCQGSEVDRVELN